MPTRAATLADHARRVARALALLAEDVSRTPSLEELAEAACFSPYHFHRTYRALVGETPAETLARLRLSHAAAMLLRAEEPLARVARASGYGSAPAFARAFREAYGIPPGAYRRAEGIGAAVLEEETMTDIVLTELPALRLVGLRHRGAYEAIGGVFDRLFAWAGPKGLFGPETRSFGLYWDDPGSVPEAEQRSMAALTVPPGFAPEPGGPKLVELPPLRCARLRHKGPYAELEAQYDRLYGDWLPASGEEPADQPCLEEYLNDPRALPPAEWLTDVFLPLRERVLAA